MDIKEIGYKWLDWIHLAQDRGFVVGSCGHGNEPSRSINRVEFLN
jgi:hypothetical protein